MYFVPKIGVIFIFLHFFNRLPLSVSFRANYECKVRKSDFRSSDTNKKSPECYSRLCKCFDKLREILRIAECGQKNGLNDQGKINSAKELLTAEKELRKYINTLKKQTKKDIEKHEKTVGVIKQMEKYWDKIFARPIKVVVDGKEKEIIPQRTNNTSAQFYRKIKHLLRRLHGRPTVSKDIDYLPEEIALIENLKNQNYVENIVGGLDTLAKKFAQLDIQKVKLDFQTNELQIKVSQKIIRRLKTFYPLRIIQDFEKLTAINN